MNKSYIAFFDVDETIIDCKTMFDFLEFYFIKTSNTFIGKLKYKTFKLKTTILKNLNVSRNQLNKNYYRCFKGSSTQFLMSLSQEWFPIFKTQMSFHTSVIEHLKQHQHKNAKVVFVSGSFMPCLAPIAKMLNVKDILAIGLEEKNGKLTGNITAPQTIGEGKATAITQFLKQYPNIDPANCYAYGDHDSDLPMLKAVGNPIAVGCNPTLTEYAKTNHGKVLNNTLITKEAQ